MRSQTSTAIKICGITKASQAKAIAEFGVDAIGVIGVDGSPRFVSEKPRRKLFDQLSKFNPDLQRVWVIADMNDAQVEKGLQGPGAPTTVQLHGKESPKRCEELRMRYPRINWWKAIRIQTPLDLSIAQRYKEHSDALLLDAWSPDALGGTGNRLPLEWIQEAKLQQPWWLAGGISSEWIPEMLDKVSPFGIDASSKLETSPGIKDLQLVDNLIKAVRKELR